MTNERLTPEEDAELRRLHMLKGFGLVAGTIASRYNALRGRDRRQEVREPDDLSVVAPLKRAAWAGKATAVPAPRASASNGAPSSPSLADTREIIAAPQPPKRGLFRR